MEELSKRLIDHLHNDLLKFWDRKEALGIPFGNFPTYRNNDGSLIDLNNLSQENQKWNRDIFIPDRDYVRMKSRQCFAYGLAYQLTSNEKYLNYMKAGLNYLIENARDDNGIFYSHYLREKDEWGPEPFQRTSQDIAYALCGFAQYYTITNDQRILDIIWDNVNFVINNFYDKKQGIIKWVIEEESIKTPKQNNLVAILDQIYAYLLPLSKCTTNPYQNDMQTLLYEFTEILINKFYWKEKNMFYGQLDSTLKGKPDGNHTDFGHSIKSFWMIYEVGILLNCKDFIDFSLQNIEILLPKAFDEKSGSWGCKFKKDCSLDRTKEWWSLCILNQVAAIFHKQNPKFNEYLNSSLHYWFEYMVDHKYGGIWHLVNGETNLPDYSFPKQHIWKNAFHEFEHLSIIMNAMSGD